MTNAPSVRGTRALLGALGSALVLATACSSAPDPSTPEAPPSRAEQPASDLAPAVEPTTTPEAPLPAPEGPDEIRPPAPAQTCTVSEDLRRCEVDSDCGLYPGRRPCESIAARVDARPQMAAWRERCRRGGRGDCPLGSIEVPSCREGRCVLLEGF